jgi:hypothetical protein
VLESRLATLREELDDQFAGGGPEDFAAVLGDPGAGAGGGGGGGGGGETGAEADDRDG